MTDIYFCRTDFDYIHPENGFGSYRDFFKLAELSGFPIIKVQEIDPSSDNVYIFSPNNGETKPGWSGARARIIFWNLEQGGHDPIPGVAEVWVSDARLAEITGARYVLMGSHTDLSADPGTHYHGTTHNYHVITLSYNTPRRIAILEQLAALEVRCAPNGWEKNRHVSLKQSTAMLHIHQNDGKNFAAPQRFALAAAYRLPLITETLDHRNGFTQSHLLMSDYANLAEFTRDWTKRNEGRILEDYGWNLYRYLCEQHPFRREVEAAL